MSYSKSKFLKAIVFIFGLFSVLILIILFSSYLSLRDSTKYGMVVIFLLGFFYYPANTKIVNYLNSLLYPKLDKKADEAVNARRGYRGEDEVNLWLEEIVGKDNIIRNVELPDCKFDMDTIIISDKGLTAIEVKNFSKKRYFEDDKYFYEEDDGNRHLSFYEDPRNELNRHANALINYLNDNDLGFIKINKIIVFANGKVSFDGKTGIFIVRDKEGLKDYMEKLTIDNNCTPEICEKIKSLLKKHSKF
jgi:hypothetical protein